MGRPMTTNDTPAGVIPAPHPVPPPSHGGSRRPDLGTLSLIAGLCIVALAGLLFAAGVFTGSGGPAPSEGLLFTIPEGAKANVARPGFDSAIQIPTEIRFSSPTEAVITVRNLDDVEHRAGPFLIGPRQTFVQRFPEPGRYPLICTVDPLETVVVTVDA
jgi:hypothetical protein